MFHPVAIAALTIAFLGHSGTLDAKPTSGRDTTGISEWQTNLRWALDFSSRGVFNTPDSFTQNIVGFDLHKVFSTADKDIGTLIFQPYIVNFSGSDSQPHFFDGRDTELTWRIANFNYRATPRGGFNIRLGHFELPFGLEQNIDTNGTLRQYSFTERGIKADWGISANGVLPQWDYELSLCRGSGNDISDRDNTYIFAGRVGSSANKNLVMGFSFFKGRVSQSIGSINRQRLGLDLALYHNHWELLAELSGGEDGDDERVQLLLEASWRNNTEVLHLYTQFNQRRVEFANRRDVGSTLSLGADITVLRDLSISGQWSKPVNRLSQQGNSSNFILQLRYRL